MDIKSCNHPLHVGERDLPVTEFYKRSRSKDGLHGWCKTCCKRENKARTAKGRQKESHRKSHRKITYDMDPQTYTRLFAIQEGKCAICGAEEGDGLMVDHNHETGEARGLLCRKCNTGLGFFNDDPAILLVAANYVHRNGLRNEFTTTDPGEAGDPRGSVEADGSSTASPTPPSDQHDPEVS